MDTIRRAPKGIGRAGSATAVIIVVIVLIAVIFVTFSLRRPPLETFPPTPADPVEVGERLFGPLLHTIDATSSTRWRFFSFSLGSVVENPGLMEWDLAFRRFQIIANGGDGFAGAGGILDLGERTFSDIHQLPKGDYVRTVARSDSTNAAVARWYSYSWTSHVLSPEPRVFAVRTADGRFAKIQIVSYYCPGGQPGCTTFRYVYQGAGGRDLSDAGAPRAGAASPEVEAASPEVEAASPEVEAASPEVEAASPPADTARAEGAGWN